MRPMPAGQFFGTVCARRSFGALRVTETSYRSGATLPLHSHESPYLCAVVQGAFTERLGRRQLDCRAGSLVLNACGAEHEDAMLADDTRVLNIELEPRWTELLARLDPRHLQTSGRLDDIRRLSAELASRDELALLVVESLAAELTAFTARDARGWTNDEGLQRVAERLRYPRAAPRLGELEQLSGLPAPELARGFRRRFGMSLGAFSRRARLQRALAAIRGSRKPLSEIAAECGFADQSHMTRCVRRAVGQTPARLRAQAAGRR